MPRSVAFVDSALSVPTTTWDEGRKSSTNVKFTAEVSIPSSQTLRFGECRPKVIDTDIKLGLHTHQSCATICVQGTFDCKLRVCGHKPSGLILERWPFVKQYALDCLDSELRWADVNILRVAHKTFSDVDCHNREVAPTRSIPVSGRRLLGVHLTRSL